MVEKNTKLELEGELTEALRTGMRGIYLANGHAAVAKTVPMGGAMLWFNEEKGHGFIATDEGERLYVPASGFADGPPEGPCAGLIVEFEVMDGVDGREAHTARLVPQLAPRRARRRRH